jgi:hypothetical protein
MFFDALGSVTYCWYLSLTAEGMTLQKSLAKTVALESPSEQLRELGSFYIGYEKDEVELLEEYADTPIVGLHRY